MAEPLGNIEFLKMLGPALGYCTLCGSVIGFERVRRGSAAGMKTQVFICVGAALFTLCSSVLVHNAGSGDAGRLIAQIVTGVGFLGAGTIMARDGVIIGLTTAAIIWIMAALGVMIGLGYGPSALVVTFGMVVAIEVMTFIERRFALPPKIEASQTTPSIHIAPTGEEKKQDRKVG